jgi:hypothetical protein
VDPVWTEKESSGLGEMYDSSQEVYHTHNST